MATSIVSTPLLPTNTRAQYNWHPLHDLGNGPWPDVALCGPKYVHSQRCPVREDKSKRQHKTFHIDVAK